jgi:hypothetical protein
LVVTQSRYPCSYQLISQTHQSRPHTLENYVKKWRTEYPSFGYLTESYSPSNDNTPQDIEGSSNQMGNASLPYIQEKLPSRTAASINPGPDVVDYDPSFFLQSPSSNVSQAPTTFHSDLYFKSQVNLCNNISDNDFIMDQEMLEWHSDYLSNLNMSPERVAEAVMINASLDELLHHQMANEVSFENPSSTNLSTGPDNTSNFVYEEGILRASPTETTPQSTFASFRVLMLDANRS